ncbi:MAG: hypothetical protein ACM3X6_09840 [Patescibacteria group bacterium]
MSAEGNAAQSWPAIRPGRLGAGVVLDAGILWALRVASAPNHARVRDRILALAGEGPPLLVVFTTLMEVADRVEEHYGGAAMLDLVAEARDAFNLVPPDAVDFTAALDVLGQGAVGMNLEQAVAGVVAKRLGCSIYGSSPGYHLMRLPVIVA